MPRKNIGLNGMAIALKLDFFCIFRVYVQRTIGALKEAKIHIES